MIADGNEQKKSVFVSGANSAAGREVVRRLVAAGYKVTAGVTSSAEATRVRRDGALPVYPDNRREGELRSAITAAKANLVVHLAPQVPNHVPHINPDWDSYGDLLREGTQGLFNAAKQAGVEYVVYVSYAFVYGDTHGENVDETAKTRSGGLDVIKAAVAGEKIALNADVPASVLRAGFVYGPDSREAIKMSESFIGSRPLPLGDNHAMLNWVHAADLAQAVVLMLEQRPNKEIFNVVDDQPTTAAAFANYFAETMNLMPTKTRGFMRSAANAATQLALLGQSSRVSNAKLKALGWKPNFASHRTGLDQILLAQRAGETFE